MHLPSHSYAAIRSLRYGDPPQFSYVHRLANIAGDLEMGDGCRIDAFVTITGKVKLGDRVHIGTGACLFGAHGITIGTAVSISPGAKIFTATEDVHSDGVSNPQLEYRTFKSGPVLIGDFSVIGANAVVLPHTTIHEQTQIGALSLVRGDTIYSPGRVYVGIPAEHIRPRRQIDAVRALTGKSE